MAGPFTSTCIANIVVRITFHSQPKTFLHSPAPSCGTNEKCHSSTLAVGAPPLQIQASHRPCKTERRDGRSVISCCYDSMSSTVGWRPLQATYLYVQQTLMSAYISSGQFAGESIRLPLSSICMTSLPFMPC